MVDEPAWVTEKVLRRFGGQEEEKSEELTYD